jgi:hypothetical protein
MQSHGICCIEVGGSQFDTQCVTYSLQRVLHEVASKNESL